MIEQCVRNFFRTTFFLCVLYMHIAKPRESILPVNVASVLSCDCTAISVNGPPTAFSVCPLHVQLVSIRGLRLGGLWSNRCTVKSCALLSADAILAGASVFATVVAASRRRTLSALLVVVFAPWAIVAMLSLSPSATAASAELMSKRNPIISEFHEPRILHGAPVGKIVGYIGVGLSRAICSYILGKNA